MLKNSWRPIDMTNVHGLRVATFEMVVEEGRLYLLVFYNEDGIKEKEALTFAPRDKLFRPDPIAS
jgi:hypothetical protein